MIFTVCGSQSNVITPTSTTMYYDILGILILCVYTCNVYELTCGMTFNHEYHYKGHDLNHTITNSCI